MLESSVQIVKKTRKRTSFYYYRYIFQWNQYLSTKMEKPLGWVATTVLKKGVGDGGLL